MLHAKELVRAAELATNERIELPVAERTGKALIVVWFALRNDVPTVDGFLALGALFDVWIHSLGGGVCEEQVRLLCRVLEGRCSGR